MTVEWVRIKDIQGKSYTYSTKRRPNAEEIRITEEKITISLKRGEDGIPTHRVFLKSSLIYYEYTSDHLQKKAQHHSILSRR
ncbi:hypothetical protein [Methanobacterium alcaliphilum]|uniref:hypothetical protein n=1 Tax=Methanobacterium alcaliphilum TaxID=392018 RepID=UPI00200AFACE|nr:hypothetical protein [Methanobacterium alcaliphilum]MCK9151183.1 hypothetical protein [Methanobacterium alcaliphilum]